MLLPSKACSVAKVVGDNKGGVQGLEVQHNDRAAVHSALGLQNQREGLQGWLAPDLRERRMDVLLGPAEWRGRISDICLRGRAALMLLGLACSLLGEGAR